MATTSVVHFTTTPQNVTFAVPNLKHDAADKVSQILQENHHKHDIIFHKMGFHNHIVHHVCTIYALGADPTSIQARYEENSSYQRAPPAEDAAVVESLADPTVFVQKLCDKTLYSSYLRFFTREIDAKGWKAVVNEYVFSGDGRANIMMYRLFGSYLHSFIHLGFGIEFEQPAIVAEGLALTCMEESWHDLFFEKTTEVLKAARPQRKSLLHILDDVRASPTLRESVQWTDGHRIKDGVFVRAMDEIVALAAKWQVNADDPLEEMVAEMINVNAYYTGAAQRPGKQVNFDFYFMHNVTSSIFFPLMLKQDWISRSVKARLIELKGQQDILQYAARRAPELLPQEITAYRHGQKLDDWQAIFRRAWSLKDDGHTCKFIRSLAEGQQVCKPFQSERSKSPLVDGDWLKLANMVMDSTEATGGTWVRSAGFDEAWEDAKPR